MKKRRVPSLSAIRAFEAVGRLNSIVDAASELHVTPTAISHQLRTLQETLDKKLFVRSGRHIQLTQDGRRLLPILTQSLDQLSDAFHDFYDPNNRREVTISATRMFARFWLHPRLDDFYAKHPDITLIIYGSDQLIDPNGSQYDLAIRYGPKSTSTNETTLFHETYYPTAHVDFPQKLCPSSNAHSEPRLIDVMWENPALTAPTWERWFKETKRTDLSAFRRTSYDSYSLAVDGLRNGHGIALLSDTIINTIELKGQLSQLPGPGLKGYYHRIVRPHDYKKKEATERFITWLQEQAVTAMPASIDQPGL